jgi:hypothetical protein
METYKKVKISITSRSIYPFENSQIGFHSRVIHPMTKYQCIEYIKKIDYNEDRKKHFINELKHNDYIINMSLTRSPLLLTLSLLVFENYAEIPKYLHIYFQQAFLCLFSQHNGTKGFSKSPRCRLSVDEFEKILCGFCFFSHLTEKYIFDETEVLDILEKSKKIFPNINFQKVEYMHDLIDYVSILIKDGLDYTFIHRSFQEYFFVKYLNTYADNYIKKITFNYLSQKKQIELTITMTCNMNKDNFGLYYIIPLLNEMWNKENIFATQKNKAKVLFKYIYMGFSIYKGSLKLEVNKNNYSRCLDIILESYYNTQKVFVLNNYGIDQDMVNDFNYNFINFQTERTWASKLKKIVYKELLPQMFKNIDAILHFQENYDKNKNNEKKEITLYLESLTNKLHEIKL